MSTPATDAAGPAKWRSRLPRLTIWLFIVALLVMAAVVFSGMNTLKNRSQRISSGMTREQVEEILGEPYLTLGRANASGELLCWVDTFWQVDVVVDGEGRVLWCRCVPANSWIRTTQSKLSSLLD